MRDRLATPFFPLGLRGLQSSVRELESLGVSARRLEGQVISNGRFLLLEKTGHTENSARFLAKDMLGDIDVEIEVHRDERKGIRVGRHDTSEHHILPDLWRGDSEPPPPPRSQRLGFLARTWRSLRRRKR